MIESTVKKPARKDGPWSRQWLIRRLQAMMEGLDTTLPAHVTAWLNLYALWSKLTGFVAQPAPKTEMGGIIVIPESESSELWEKRLEIEQAEALRSAESDLATNSGTANSSS